MQPLLLLRATPTRVVGGAKLHGRFAGSPSKPRVDRRQPHRATTPPNGPHRHAPERGPPVYPRQWRAGGVLDTGVDTTHPGAGWQVAARL